MTYKRSKCDNDAILLQFSAIKFHYLGKLDKRCSDLQAVKLIGFTYI